MNKLTDIYQLINYFDVLGNEKDGFEVNNSYKEDFTIELQDYTNVKEIIKKLKEVDFLSNHCTSNMFEVRNDYEMIEFFKKNGDPLFRLELIR